MENKDKELTVLKWVLNNWPKIPQIPKGRSILFNHFKDMRTTVNLSISCRKNVFLLENFNILRHTTIADHINKSKHFITAILEKSRLSKCHNQNFIKLSS